LPSGGLERCSQKPDRCQGIDLTAVDSVGVGFGGTIGDVGEHLIGSRTQPPIPDGLVRAHHILDCHIPTL